MDDKEKKPEAGSESWGVSADAVPRLLPLEEYVQRFSKRYSGEEAFREIVHNYLGIGFLGRARLSVGKTFFKSWYDKKTDEMVRQYAVQTREQLEEAVRAKQELEMLERQEKSLDLQAGEVSRIAEQKQKAVQEYAVAETEKKDSLKRIESEASAKTSQEEALAAQRQEEIKRKTDAEALVRERLKEHILSSSLVRVSDHGEIRFDDEKMTQKLEDIFLKEIIEGINAEDGHNGFYSKIKSAFDGVVSHWAELEDLGELKDVDWVQSAIYSRTRGYRLPTFPYLISAKRDPGQTMAKTSIDTAICLDSSGSMENNNRWAVARKTSLATRALMRRLSPNNQSYFACFSNNIYEMTPVELMNSSPGGGTNTDLALKWLLNKLQGRGPSIAYLATDGAPSVDIDRVVKAAGMFRDHPYIKLRIILIDGDENTEDITRKIGKAAGDTKVIPVKNYQLPGGMLRDISEVIGGMYDIDRF